nr:immunoglobulin heavy chain junction region [Macaca mulatta]
CARREAGIYGLDSW